MLIGINILKKLGFNYSGAGEYIADLKDGVTIIYTQKYNSFEFYKWDNDFPFIETDDISEFLEAYEKLC